MVIKENARSGPTHTNKCCCWDKHGLRTFFCCYLNCWTTR